MTIERQRIGKLGEREACRRLLEDGYAVKALNWRCRSGEIDIVAEQGGRLVFIEVRARSAASAGRFGTAAESVDYRKQRKVRTAAQAYLLSIGRPHAAVRFDVIAVTVGADDAIEYYRHYEAAF